MKRVLFIILCVLSLNCLKTQTPAICATDTQKAESDQLVASEAEAEQMVASIGNQIITLIKQTSLPAQKKEDRFREILTQNFSLQNIAQFVLGRYWRIATPAERKKYVKLFEDVVIEHYVSQFGDYLDEALEVVKSRPGVAGGIMVATSIHRTDQAPVKVDWFLRPTKGGLKVFDLFIAGVSLSITQRSEYAAIIRKHGGQIQGLLDEMQRQIDTANAQQAASRQAPPT